MSNYVGLKPTTSQNIIRTHKALVEIPGSVPILTGTSKLITPHVHAKSTPSLSRFCSDTTVWAARYGEVLKRRR